MNKRLRLYHNKTRSIASQKIDTLRDQCRNSITEEESLKNSYKPLLLQSYERYTNAKRKNLHAQMFQVQIYNSQKLTISRPRTCRTSGIMSKSLSNKNKTLQNWQSTDLSLNKNGFNSFFPTQYGSSQKGKSIVSQKASKILSKSTSLPIDPIIKFLKDLYSQKINDLKIVMNEKQQEMFISRLSQLVNKKQISVVQCDLGYHSICVIVKNLLSNPAFNFLKKLHLDRNNLSDKGIIKLSTALEKCQILQDLSMVSVDMGNSGAVHLFSSIQGHPTLKKLNLSSDEGKNRNRIGSAAIRNFKCILKHSGCKLSSINLANTGIGSEGFIYLCEGLQSYPIEIDELNISGNQIRIKAQDEVILRNRLQNTPIKKFIAHNNNLSDIGAHFFSFLLGISYGKSEISKSMYYLDLSANHIKSKGLEYLAMSLSKNRKLSELYLAYNDLNSGQSFYTIKYLLINNWNLSKLSLKKSIHDSSCIKILAQGLQANRSLYWLDISENKLCLSSFFQLFDRLIQNKTLRILKLDSCSLNDEYIEKIQNLLKINKCLQSISFRNNYINNKGAKILLRILMQNRKICELYLKRNCINVHILNQISYQLKDNNTAVMSQGDPDIKYYENATKMQESHKINLLQTIKNLQKKSQQLLAQNVIEEIAQKQIQITKYSTLIQKEDKKIKLLEQQLQNSIKQAKIGNKS